MKAFQSLCRFLSRKYYYSSSDRFCKYLRINGIEIGGGCHFDPGTTRIDLTRPSLITIGDNCYMNKGFTILTHDWVTHVFLHSGKMFINSSGHVHIGNNCGFGENVTILKGVTIGNNCFIGAGSIVTHDIPDNSIAVGSPCKIVKSLDEYYKQRLVDSENEALDYARSIYERYQRLPTIDEFKEEFIYFVSGDEIDNYPMLPIRRQLGPCFDQYRSNHIAKYKSFEEFLKAAGINA